jgi:hypothetical protein
LRIAEIITDETQVRRSESAPWIAYVQIENHGEPPPGPVASESEHFSRQYYYLDEHRNPVGPVKFETLSNMASNGILRPATLIAAEGDSEWVPVSSVVSIRNPASPAIPKFRSFGEFSALMGLSLSFYSLYLVPSYSRDLEVITGKRRTNFRLLMVLGIVTFGFLLCVMSVLWAFELEKLGVQRDTAGRQESLGAYVLTLFVIAVTLGFFGGGLAFVMNVVFCSAGLWLLQKEINLYAKLNTQEVLK